MYWHFSKKLISQIFVSKNKQYLLIISFVGLFLSSFALLFLHATMGGLQNGLISRSKYVEGDAVVHFSKATSQFKSIRDDLIAQGLNVQEELNLELLLKNGEHVAPAKLTGLKEKKFNNDFYSQFSDNGIYLGRELAHKLNASHGSQVQVISPVETISLLGEIPRSASEFVVEVIKTPLPEQEAYYGWVRIGFLQNLMRTRGINTLRIFGEYNYDQLKSDLNARYGNEISLVTWEESNNTLLWAFRLETSMMIFLFICMCLLVAVAITSGLLVFFSRLEKDLLGLWILGMDQENIGKLTRRFLFLINLSSIILGVTTSVTLLLLLDKVSPDIMPSIFVERKIPVKITSYGVGLAFFVPLVISTLFSNLTLKFLQQNDEKPLQKLRGFV